MKLGQVMADELRFKSKISKMGNNRIIWVPAALQQMIKEFKKNDVMISIKKIAKK